MFRKHHLHLLAAFSVALLCAAPAIAADNFNVKDASSTTITKRSKDVGGGVQADLNGLIDAASAQINPATKEGVAAVATALQDSQSVPGTTPAKTTATTNYLPQLTTTAHSGLYGVTAVQLMPANAARHFVVLQVQSTTASCYMRGAGVSATADYNSLLVGPGAYFESSTHVGTGIISIICTAASTPVYSIEG